MNFDERRYRPMGTADLFDEAFDLYKKNFILFLGAAALTFAPLTIFLDFYHYSANQAFLSEFALAIGQLDLGRLWDVTWAYLMSSYALLPIYFVIYSLMTGALVAAVSARYLNQPMTILGAYLTAISRWLPLLSSLLLFDILVLFGGFFCFVPALIPYVLFLFAPQTAIVEGKIGFRALGRAQKLMAGNSGRLLGCLVMVWALYWVLYFAMEGPLSYFAGQLVNSSLPLLPALAAHQQLADQIAGQLTSVLVAPFLTAVVTVLYYDMRIRKEGFDMDVLAASLGYPRVEMATVRPFGAAPTAPRPMRVAVTKRGRR